MLAGVMPVVGRTGKEAFEKLNTLQSFVSGSNALAILSDRFGRDMSAYDLDGPIPDIAPSDSYHSFASVMLAKGRRENMTLRDLYNLTAAARGHWVLCGSAERIADTLQHWFLERAADGFNVMPPYFHAGFEDFVDLVVPILQERGLFRRTTRARRCATTSACGDPATRSSKRRPEAAGSARFTGAQGSPRATPRAFSTSGQP